MEPAKPELSAQKSGDAIDFGIALQNDKIKDVPVEHLKQVLRLIMVKIGLRQANWPGDEEKFLLIQHIIQHYGGHTPEELLLAFDMAIAGKLDVEINCYENFSCLYVSTIMNAYRSWAKDQHKELKPVMIENKVSDITNQDWFNETKKQVQEKKLTVDFVPVELYEWALKEGLINPTTAEKWDYMLQAINLRQGKLYADLMMDGESKANIHLWTEFMRMKKNECFEGDELKRLRSLSKKLILFDYMKEVK